MARDNGNLLAGVVLAAFGVYVISVALRLPYASDVGPGPGFFPLWLGIGLVLFACGLMFASFAAVATEAKSPAQSPRVWVRSLSGWLAVMTAIALLARLGFAVSFVILTIFLIVVLDRRPLWLGVGVGVALAAVFYLLFVVALDVSLPKAVWGF